jgi:hypothetical protein
VLAGTRTAKAGFTRADGTPLVTPVWITFDGDDVVFTTEVRKWATVLGGRYMGADRAGEYGARNGVPGAYLVRVTPAKVVARRGIAD